MIQDTDATPVTRRAQILRVHRPQRHGRHVDSAAAIRSELAWLGAIAAGSDLSVPEPLPAHDGIPTVEEYVAEYCRLTGRSGLPQLDWYFSYNLFRLAGICQGIVGRVRDGTAASSHAALMEARVPLLANAGWAFAQKAGA